MIYIRTHAYNAEKTIRETIESVLNQTYQDFQYHILDNGSTDGTGDIIREYAERDKRIVPYYSRKNHDITENLDFWNLSKRIPEEDFFCVLDADDFYDETFLWDMLRFMKDNRLDMAACGTCFFDGESGDILENRTLSVSVILDQPQRWNDFFRTIYWNLRQVWGKLYTGKVAAARYETEKPDWFPGYGGDTINVFQCALAAKSVGVYGKKLHNYRVSKKSVSYRWLPKREDADVILYEKALEFIKQKSGTVSEENLRFLYSVYYSAIHDTVYVLTRSGIPKSEQIEIMLKILSCDTTRHMLTTDVIAEEERETFFDGAIRWLTLSMGKDSAKKLQTVERICKQLNPDFLQLIPVDQLAWYIQNVPQAVTALALCEYEAALRHLTLFVGKGKKATVSVILLVQTLAALLQKQDIYIQYEKLLIERLMEQNDLQKAEEELTEWEQILQGDEELASLRDRLSHRKAR